MEKMAMVDQPQASQIVQNQRRVVFVTLMGFLGAVVLATLVGTVGLRLSAPLPQPQSIGAEMPSDRALHMQMQGYQQVLQREPNNIVALEGLVATQLGLNNFSGAIESLEKLVELYPERAQYSIQLAAVKQLTSHNQLP